MRVYEPPLDTPMKVWLNGEPIEDRTVAIYGSNYSGREVNGWCLLIRFDEKGNVLCDPAPGNEHLLVTEKRYGKVKWEYAR